MTIRLSHLYRWNRCMKHIEQSVKKEKVAAVEWLCETFPNAFFKKPHEIKPLQIGIYDDILDFYERLDAPPFSKKILREAINYYSSSKAYLCCQKANVARVDLYGNEVDAVSEEQAKYAYQRCQERFAAKTPTVKPLQKPIGG